MEKTYRKSYSGARGLSPQKVRQCTPGGMWGDILEGMTATVSPNPAQLLSRQTVPQYEWPDGGGMPTFGTEYYVSFSSVQSIKNVWLFATPWIAAHQASLSITITRSSLKLTSTEFVMLSSHLILCRPLLLLPPIPPSIKVFSNESTFHMRWPKYRSFSFSISPSKEIPGLISFRMDWLDLLAV